MGRRRKHLSQLSVKSLKVKNLSLKVKAEFLHYFLTDQNYGKIQTKNHTDRTTLNSRQQQQTSTTEDTFVPDPIDTEEILIAMEENLLQYDHNPSLQNEFKSDRENRVSFKLC
jgi:hypothetical protein